MGVLFLTFATWYGTVRIITDFLRVDKRFFGLTGSQWASVAVVTLSVLTLIRFALRPVRAGPADAGPHPRDPAPQPARPKGRSPGLYPGSAPGPGSRLQP